MTETEAADTKSCCAAAYAGPWAELLLGDSFHPGGVALTLRLGQLMGLRPGLRLLDVACGRGTSAIALAREFGCSVHGIDLSPKQVEEARERADAAGVGHLVTFSVGDSEAIPLSDGAFDAVLCECALCMFPAKGIAAAEFARVLSPGGRLGLSDVTCSGELPPELCSLIARIACIADALPLEGYAALLRRVGFEVQHCAPHHRVLTELVSKVRLKLLAIEVLARLGKAPVPLHEVVEGKRIAQAAAASIRDGTLSYGVLVGMKR